MELGETPPLVQEDASNLRGEESRVEVNGELTPEQLQRLFLLLFPEKAEELRRACQTVGWTPLSQQEAVPAEREDG
jgi:hypothetical protein